MWVIGAESSTLGSTVVTAGKDAASAYVVILHSMSANAGSKALSTVKAAKLERGVVTGSGLTLTQSTTK